MTAPASCSRCGRTWPRDPALEVACPTCRVPVGQRCTRPSGYRLQEPHITRDRAALAAVPGYAVCPGERLAT